MTTPEPDASRENLFTAADVATILRERSWHNADLRDPQTAWCQRAAALLGPHCSDRAALEGLLTLVFRYDAQEILAQVDSHLVLSRYAARDALRELASQLLDPAPLTTERFNLIIDAIKTRLDIRGRELFHTLRLALAGRVGQGELDRVALLLDDAAAANFSTPVKSARTRIIEFCAALD
jgi:glutamyl-tRNA synthetase/nondiscriminating glutamyl-tRNA synthetase